MRTPTSSLPARPANRSRRSGQTATEYILMIAFIVLVGVGIASAMGASVQGLLANVNSALQAALGPKPAPASPKS